MAGIYAQLIRKGVKRLEDVPMVLRQAVRELLEALELPGLAE